MRYVIEVIYGDFHIKDTEKDTYLFHTPVKENALQITRIMNFDNENCYKVYGEEVCNVS